MFIRTEDVITYTEFLAATLDKKYFTEDIYVRVAFDRIDLNGSGAIKMDNISQCFERFGYKLNDAVLLSFFDEFDLLQDGQISYDEFKKALGKGF